MHHVYLFVIIVEGDNPRKEGKIMLNPREVQDAIDDVLGKTKDPMRLIRDFLKQVDDYANRVKRLENKLTAQIREKEQCGGNWAEAISILEKIEETECLVSRAKEQYEATVDETKDVIGRLDDDEQKAVLTMRYVGCVSDWGKIAEVVGKPKSEIRRIHTAALPEVKRILEQIEKERNTD